MDTTDQRFHHEKEVSLRNVVKSKKFRQLYAIAVCYMFYGIYIMTSYKSLGANTINDDAFLTFMGSFGALFNGCMRPFWSSLLDHYSFRSVFGFLIVL
jgi:hypothetical protein